MPFLQLECFYILNCSLTTSFGISQSQSQLTKSEAIKVEFEEGLMNFSEKTVNCQLAEMIWFLLRILGRRHIDAILKDSLRIQGFPLTQS